ncbi:hypothetical protein BC834DRAFT_69501 [Gloeopeniophorella convolvens]|nr:hypothetical protein BC834DRAFT_69501 [Gloeopeniophorella convolvens]
MTSLLDLPTELLIQIFDAAVATHPCPGHILVLNKLIYRIASPLPYRHLHFSSLFSIACFPSTSWGLDTVHKPSTITIELAGGEVGKGVFRQLSRLLGRARFPRDAVRSNRLELDSLRLCLHSTSDSEKDDRNLFALDLVNPQSFKWTGPDPAHHFSIAIVATAVNVLFKRFQSWTRLQDLHLSNISFPKDIEGLFPPLPTLRSLYLGQATLVPVVPLARALIDPQMGALTTVRLVDCYVESIWGPRLRRRDLERAVTRLCTGNTPLANLERDDARSAPALHRVGAIVRCEARTERIIGGDRAERTGDLE